MADRSVPPTARPARHAAGSATSGHGGTTSDTAIDAPAHEIVVELKDTPSKTVPNTTGLPPGFPASWLQESARNRQGAGVELYLAPGKPTPMHFHNTEVVVAYLGNGDVAATTPDGKTTVTHHNPGDIVFNVANRSHSEELVKGEHVRHHAGAEIARSRANKGIAFPDKQGEAFMLKQLLLASVFAGRLRAGLCRHASIPPTPSG